MGYLCCTPHQGPKPRDRYLFETFPVPLLHRETLSDNALPDHMRSWTYAKYRSSHTWHYLLQKDEQF